MSRSYTSKESSAETPKESPQEVPDERPSAVPRRRDAQDESYLKGAPAIGGRPAQPSKATYTK